MVRLRNLRRAKRVERVEPMPVNDSMLSQIDSYWRWFDDGCNFSVEDFVTIRRRDNPAFTLKKDFRKKVVQTLARLTELIEKAEAGSENVTGDDIVELFDMASIGQFATNPAHLEPEQILEFRDKLRRLHELLSQQEVE